MQYLDLMSLPHGLAQLLTNVNHELALALGADLIHQSGHLELLKAACSWWVGGCRGLAGLKGLGRQVIAGDWPGCKVVGGCLELQ